MVNLFENIHPIYVLFFLYGAAFLILGLSITIKDMKGSDLPLKDSLWLLGMFGFTHGAREWIEIYPLVEGNHLSPLGIFQAKAVSVAMMLISFLFLLQFGLSLAQGIKRRRLWWIAGLPSAFFIIWVLFGWRHGFVSHMQFLRHVEIGGRNTFGITGALVTAYGLIAYSHEIKYLSNSIARRLFYAGITFAFYGVFASNFFSTAAYFFLPLPAEVFRGVSAVLITYFVIKALNIFNVETRKK